MLRRYIGKQGKGYIERVRGREGEITHPTFLNQLKPLTEITLITRKQQASLRSRIFIHFWTIWNSSA